MLGNIFRSRTFSLVHQSNYCRSGIYHTIQFILQQNFKIMKKQPVLKNFLLSIPFFFAAFILWSQQGKAYYHNTWFYEHKVVCALIATLLFVFFMGKAIFIYKQGKNK